MKCLTFFFLFCSLVACKTPQKAAENRLIEVENELVIDLESLKNDGAFPETEVFSSTDDPVYHKTKRFNAFPLKPFLQKYWNFDEIAVDEMEIVFECEDGYKPEMPLSKFLSVHAYLAISDADAPNGRAWEQVLKGEHEMKVAPFYIFYNEDVPSDDYSYKRPYNLVKIHIEPTTQNELPIPAETLALAGYHLFQTHCKTCHSLNGIGGGMGPELNYPKNITEYWKTDDLVAFIVNPAAYRSKVKMPALGITTEQSREIVRYLEYVKKATP